mmetsp:Transcript_11841/g.17827  ORF Transcript_11841/g.17827 Transcript_11841/m.17827 type:complete len:158 (-) Transcript_11841:57-530(-)
MIIPTEIIANILSHLEFDETARFARVSKDWMRSLKAIDKITLQMEANNLHQKLEFATKHFLNLKRLQVFMGYSLPYCAKGPNTAESVTAVFDQIHKLLSASPKIEEFHFQGCMYTDMSGETLKPLSRAVHLKVLRLENCRFSAMSDLIDILQDKKCA